MIFRVEKHVNCPTGIDCYERCVRMDSGAIISAAAMRSGRTEYDRTLQGGEPRSA